MFLVIKSLLTARGTCTVILLQIGMVGPGTHLVKDRESLPVHNQ